MCKFPNNILIIGEPESVGYRQKSLYCSVQSGSFGCLFRAGGHGVNEA